MMDDKTLEEKAHAFAVRWGFQVGGQFEASLLPVLREVAEEWAEEVKAEARDCGMLGANPAPPWGAMMDDMNAGGDQVHRERDRMAYELVVERERVAVKDAQIKRLLLAFAYYRDLRHLIAGAWANVPSKQRAKAIPRCPTAGCGGVIDGGHGGGCPIGPALRGDGL